VKIRAVLEIDESTGEWAVWCPELPGCASWGSTRDEALMNIAEAISLYLEPTPIEFSGEEVVVQLAA